MDCPRDTTEMTELTDGEERLLFRCAECGGLWLEVADLNRLLLHHCLPTLAPPPVPRPAPEAPKPPPPPVMENVKEQEPNDYQRAQQIPANAVVAGAIDAPKDEDWYRIAPGPLTAMRVELSGVAATLEV